MCGGGGGGALITRERHCGLRDTCKQLSVAYIPAHTAGIKFWQFQLFLRVTKLQEKRSPLVLSPRSQTDKTKYREIL